MKRRRVGIAGIRQLVDDIDKFGATTWPAMGHDQRGGIGACRPPVQKVNAEAVDHRAPLPDSIESFLERPPVVLGTPIVDGLDEVGKRDALFPSARAGRHRLGFREARSLQPRA